jgi:DNA-binding XRE family transcriptional regulator
MLSRIATLPRKINFTLNIYALSENDSMGVRIMKLRKAKNLTAKELGERINLTGAGIISYENDNAYPSKDALLRLVATLGKDVLCDDYSKFIIKQYGPIIKQWRRGHNLTCDQAAKYIGASTRTLYAIENMEYTLSRKVFNQHKKELIKIVLTT